MGLHPARRRTAADDLRFLDVQAADEIAPTLATSSGIVVSPGMHAWGNIVRGGIPFSEIVTVPETATLSTSWGVLAYEAGSGGNVLTFQGVIDVPLGSRLIVNGLDEAVADLVGNVFAGSVAKNFGSTSYAIAYDLAGGDPGPGFPASYTFGEAVELVAATREGYVFAGWTGTRGFLPRSGLSPSAATPPPRNLSVHVRTVTSETPTRRAVSLLESPSARQRIILAIRAALLLAQCERARRVSSRRSPAEISILILTFMRDIP